MRIPLTARSTTEAHRAASQLELLFDLTFVIAIATVTLELAHRIADGHAVDGIIPFLQVFFAIWWAWMNFTWFASAYDNGDAIYRILTMVQMAGVLVLAAGVPGAIDDGVYRTITIGYLIMRTGLIALWVRAAVDCRPTRPTALRYAGGVAALNVAWVLRFVFAENGALPDGWLTPVFAVLAAAELAVPWWAERAPRSDGTSWHPHHIAERYGLFTIILLGESLLATSTGVTAALDGGAANGEVVTVAGGGFVLTMALWWRYFLDRPGDGLARHRHRSFRWGYGHFAVFAALAAVGAGLEVAAADTAGDVAARPVTVGYAVAVPVAVFLAAVPVVNAPLVARPTVPGVATLAAVTVVLILPLGAAFTSPGIVVVAIGAACAVLTGFATVDRGSDQGRPRTRPPRARRHGELDRPSPPAAAERYPTPHPPVEASMSFYLSNADTRPTGLEPLEFLDAPDLPADAVGPFIPVDTVVAPVTGPAVANAGPDETGWNTVSRTHQPGRRGWARRLRARSTRSVNRSRSSSPDTGQQ